MLLELFNITLKPGYKAGEVFKKGLMLIGVVGAGAHAQESCYGSVRYFRLIVWNRTRPTPPEVYGHATYYKYTPLLFLFSNYQHIRTYIA